MSVVLSDMLLIIAPNTKARSSGGQAQQTGWVLQGLASHIAATVDGMIRLTLLHVHSASGSSRNEQALRQPS